MRTRLRRIFGSANIRCTQIMSGLRYQAATTQCSRILKLGLAFSELVCNSHAVLLIAMLFCQLAPSKGTDDRKPSSLQRWWFPILRSPGVKLLQWNLPRRLSSPRSGQSQDAYMVGPLPGAEKRSSFSLLARLHLLAGSISRTLPIRMPLPTKSASRGTAY